MGKKDEELTSFSAGGRPGRENPKGWTNGGDRSEEDGTTKDNTSPVYGYGPDRPEGWHQPTP